MTQTTDAAGPSESRREIKADVEFLFDLVDKVVTGRLRVPDFPRAYVWGRQAMLDLLDSVRRQYPFGSLLLWRTSKPYRSRKTLGPLALPDPAPSDLTLILDGQQRLTTLAALLVPEKDRSVLDSEDPGRWSVVFDAAQEGGIFMHVERGAKLEPTQVPLYALRDTYDIIRACEAIAKTGRPDAKILVDRVQELARAFARCKVPLSLFISDDLTAAVDIYVRLNQKGRRVSADEMVSALVSTEGGQRFDLASSISAMLERIRVDRFGEVERSVPLRVTLALADRDIYKTDWTRLADDLRGDPSMLQRAEAEAQSGLEAATRFLVGEGVPNARLLPYGIQLVALAVFFARHVQPSPAQRELLTKWLWSSSFAAGFGIGNPGRVRRVVEEIRDGLGDDPNAPELVHYDLATPALPLPSRFDLRSARLRGTLCALLALKPLGADGEPLPAAELLLRDGPAAMVPVCGSITDATLRNSPANRIFALDNKPGQAKETLLGLDASVRDRVLESHAIRPDTLTLLQDRKHDEFLQARLEEIARVEREFMTQHGVVLPPEGPLTSAAPIDTDD